MNHSFFILLLSFLVACGGEAKTDLKIFRDSAFYKLIEKRTDSTVTSPLRYKSFIRFFHTGLLEGFFTLLQADNIDRSWVIFRFDGETKETTCGLYIREIPTTSELALNLIDCKGPQSRSLKGSNFVVSLSELQ